jgi:hypothetical protein
MLGQIGNMDVIGLGKYSSPIVVFLFDCPFKGKEREDKERDRGKNRGKNGGIEGRIE